MATFPENLEKIRTSILGEDMRGAIHDAIEQAYNSSGGTHYNYFRGSYPTRADLLSIEWQSSDKSLPNYAVNNDFAYVTNDELHDNETWIYCYLYESGGSNNGWHAQSRANVLDEDDEIILQTDSAEDMLDGS